MRTRNLHRRLAIAFLIGALAIISSSSVYAHCDTMDGPVIAAAREALETGNVNLALVWVQPEDEDALREEFDRALEARGQGGERQSESERRFFESFVRIHRAGEGAPYTGIRPAGTEIDPGVRAADDALETGSPGEVQQILEAAVRTGLERQFNRARELRTYDPDDVSAGRAYVAAYVEYTHFVEGIHQAATATGHHQHSEEDGHAEGEHDGAHTAGHAGHQGHEGHTAHLPWLLVVLLASALCVETVFLVARGRRRAT